MANPPPTIFYADGVASQATFWLMEYHLASRGGVLTVRPYASIAPCDIVNQVRSDLRGDTSPHNLAPRVIALSFYGLSGSPCMDGESVGSPAFLSKYEDDLTRISAAADFMSVPVYWIKPPPRQPGPTVDLDDDLAAIATGLDWHVVDAGVAVSSSGLYTDTMSCLVGEGAPEGCVSGSVTVRDGDYFEFSGSYSSGARRWAAAAVQGMPEVSSVPDPNCYVWDCPVSED